MGGSTEYEGSRAVPQWPESSVDMNAKAVRAAAGWAARLGGCHTAFRCLPKHAARQGRAGPVPNTNATNHYTTLLRTHRSGP